MITTTQQLESANVDTFTVEFVFVDDMSLEFVGGGAITNTL